MDLNVKNMIQPFKTSSFMVKIKYNQYIYKFISVKSVSLFFNNIITSIKRNIIFLLR